MAYDLVLKNVKKNWSRGASHPQTATERLTAAAPTPPTLAELKLTPDEKKKLADVAAIKKAAQSGDKRARRQWKKAPKIVAKLSAKAAKGDPKAQRSLQILRAAKVFAPGAVLLGEFIGKDEILGSDSRSFIGAYATQILGPDLNDDEAAVARDGGQCERDSLARVRGCHLDGEFIGREFIGQYPQQGSRRKMHHLRKIVRRAARGDANALAKMQQVQQNLTTRANSGDQNAATLLNKISQWYAADQAQYQSSQAATATAPAPVAPYQAPSANYYPGQPAPSPYQQPYPGQQAPGALESELDTSDPEL